MELRVDLKNTGITEEKFSAAREDAAAALGELWSGDLDFTGWVNGPNETDDIVIDDLLKTAERIRGNCDFFIVLGVGGSFMGAKAVTDALGGAEDGPGVLFAGYNFSGRYIHDLMNRIDGRDICLCVISKSGTTTETLSAYGIFRELMIEKYGRAETARRTFVITEHRSNYLFDEAAAEGCTVFELALDIGGRYSVLTAVGLLPLAVAGIDIKELLRGARSIAREEAFRGNALDYAAARNIFYRGGKRIEVFEFFDPYFAYFGEWLKQLFGESEGKEGKGLFPASLMFSRDLHSMGQFLQQGTQDFFETFITVDSEMTCTPIPDTAMKPFAGKTIEQIDRCAEKGVLSAHVKAGVPVISIHIPELDAFHMGEVLYFFETECAVSALLSGVDPFNQPGVEAYKKEMRAYITELDETR